MITTHKISCATASPAVGGHAANGAKATVDIWLEANIKALNAAEYRLYRSYLVPGARPVRQGTTDAATSGAHLLALERNVAGREEQDDGRDQARELGPGDGQAFG